MGSNKNFFLISFLPALAYWYLEANYSLEIALVGGIALAVLEMSLEWLFTKHIHTLSKFNFYLILVLGGIALIGKEGIWFKLQPFFTGVLMGGYLFWRNKRGKGIMWELVGQASESAPPKFIIDYIERNFSVFLFIYGLFMAFVAIYLDSDMWLFFKTIGFYIASAVFMLIQTIFIRKKVKQNAIK